MNTSEHNPQTTTTSWFRTAAPYIHAHRDATFVVAFDDATIAGDGFDNLIHDLALLDSLGIQLVLVFGARQQINTQLEAENINYQFHNGLRVTQADSLSTIESVIGKLRINIEAKLSFSMPHTPMADSKLTCCSGNWVTAKLIGIIDGVDLGNTGQVRRVDANAINAQLSLGNIVLLPPLGYSPTGEVFDLSYANVATEVAKQLKADKLIFIGESTDGLAREMNLEQAESQASSHPFVEAVEACQNGVNRVHLLDRNSDGALLQELFSRDGAGVLISAELFEVTRQATIDDVSGILELISPLEKAGTLVKRSREHLEIEIDHFTVMERDGKVIACAAMYTYQDCKTAELACLAVSQSYQDAGRGKKLLETLEKNAKQQGLTQLCVLTTQTTHWFLEHGFNDAEINDLPLEKQALYNYQRNSKVLLKAL
jgi:amino-acid N-acetyltransferase